MTTFFLPPCRSRGGGGALAPMLPCSNQDPSVATSKLCRRMFFLPGIKVRRHENVLQLGTCTDLKTCVDLRTCNIVKRCVVGAHFPVCARFGPTRKTCTDTHCWPQRCHEGTDILVHKVCRRTNWRNNLCRCTILDGNKVCPDTLTASAFCLNEKGWWQTSVLCTHIHEFLYISHLFHFNYFIVISNI